MFRIKIIFLFFWLFLSFNVSQVFAAEAKQVMIVNPIRGGDFWQYSHQILDTPKKEYEIISQNNLAATWLVRYDALINPDVVNFLKSFNKQQEVGLFFEITPTLTKDSGVKYNESTNWHSAKSVFLIGYSPDDRRKLIDQAVKKYQELYKVKPKSVGAWWIDAFSLNYLRDKHGVEANLDVADQHSTDQYQVWGQYFSLPFYPSKSNALMPAQSVDRKIGVVTVQWAPRDPYNGYGGGVFESTHSVQANDYMLHNLDVRYFEKLLNIYPQLVVGLENDFTWDQFGSEYTKQIDVLVDNQRAGELSVKTLANFAAYYAKANPLVSPEVVIATDDPLGTDGKVVWYQTPKYRVGWFFGPYGSVIRDLRLFNEIQEECFTKACSSLDLAYTNTRPIDDITFSNGWLIDEGTISDFRVNKLTDGLEIGYKNQSGTDRSIKFYLEDMAVNSVKLPLSVAIQKAQDALPMTTDLVKD